MSNYTIVGIDFGTSTSVVKVKNYYNGMRKNECQPLIIQGNASVPTQVFKREDGALFYGSEVDSEIQSGSNGEVFRNFKMDLIHPDNEKRQLAQEMTRNFFLFLYEQFNKQRAPLHVCNEVKTYVSYPAKWTPDVISFMKQCAIDAGFGDQYSVFGETEPTAAIYAALTNNEDKIKENSLIAQNKPINILMLDMGAGTSDVTIFKFNVDSNNKFYIGYKGQIVSHPAIDNAYLCGGREIDSILCNYNKDYLEKVVTQRPFPEGLIKINVEGVKGWKEASVSKRLASNTAVPIPGYLSASLNMLRQFNVLSDDPYVDIDRGVFELITMNHWRQLHSLLLDAIEKASRVITELNGPEDIDLVIVTGGHSQWYCVKDLLLGRSIAGLPGISFKKLISSPERILSESRPHETVASGLTYRDLEFDVTHTASNNLWLKFVLNDSIQSELFNPLSACDTIPCEKSIVWNQEIIAHTSTLGAATIRCECFYGTDMTSAFNSTAECSVNLNSLSSLIISIPLSIFGDKDTYNVSVIASVVVNEDGSGYIDGRVTTQYNDDGDRFHINL